MSTSSVATKRIPFLRALGGEQRGTLSFEFRDIAIVLVSLAALPLTSSVDHWYSIPPIVRIALGLLYVFAIPGYCLVAVLFPSRVDLEPIERLGLSVGGSIALTPIIVAVLDRLGWGLHYWTIAAAEGSVTTLLLTLAIVRRLRLPADARFVIGTTAPSASPSGSFPGMRPVLLGIAVALVLTAALGAWLRWSPAIRPDLTEFYVLGADGVAEGYPRSVAVREPLSATFGIVNHGASEQRFRIVGWAVDSWNAERREQVLDLPELFLPAGQRALWSAEWRMPWVGDDQMTELELYRDGLDRPYRRLRLWVNVLPDQAGQTQVPLAQAGSAPSGPWGVRAPAPAPIVLAPVPRAERAEPAPLIGLPEDIGEAPATPAEPTVPSTAESSPATDVSSVTLMPGQPPAAALPAAVDVSTASLPTESPATSPALVWMTNGVITEMWSGPEAGTSFGQTTAASCAFLVLESPQGNRALVLNPHSQNYLWIERQVLSPADPPVPASGPGAGEQNCSDTVPQYPVRGTVLDERYGQDSSSAGAYRLEAPADGAYRVLEAPVGNQLANVILEATIRPLTMQEPGSSFGVVIRTGREDTQPAGDQPGRFYLFRVSVDGSLSVSRRTGGQWADISQKSAFGAVGERVQLSVAASGDELVFFMDGMEVDRVRDTMLTDGGVGVYVDGPTTSVAVERLTVQVPY